MDMEDCHQQDEERSEISWSRSVRKLTVHTTELFRDPDIWKKIKNHLLPSFKDKPAPSASGIPGCSTGQEVYSMMMMLDELGLLEKTEIYGSDLNHDVLETARKGTYKYHFNQSYLENFDRVMLNGTGHIFMEQQETLEKIFPHR